MKIIKLCMGLVLTAILMLQGAKINAAEDASAYLILSDIPPYQRITKTIDMITEKVRTIPGYTIYSHPGVVAGADHFSADHADMTYRTKYQSKEIGLGMVAEVTKHINLDSDKWLLHELERDFRTYYGLPGDSYVMRVIDGNTIMAAGSGGWD